MTSALALLNASEKCCWLLIADKGAPTFKVSTIGDVLDSNWDIHYVEYQSTFGGTPVVVKSDWIDGSTSNTSGANKIYGKIYGSVYD